MAKTVNGPGGLEDVLSHVVRTTRQLLGADRATVLLLDDSGRLRPAVSAARTSDEGLYSQFRAMNPILVNLNQAQRQVLADGRAIAIDDARHSPVVPDEWRETFALQSLALVPLATGDEPFGVLVVDSDSSRPFGLQELAAMEGIAASTSTAVRAARELEAATARSERLRRTLAFTSALNATPRSEHVLDLALECFLDILQARSCSINVLQADRLSFLTVSSRGPDQPPVGRHLLTDVSASHLAMLRSTWGRDPSVPFVYDVDAMENTRVTAPERGVLLPLCQEGKVRGVALVSPAPELVLSSELLELATSVAGQVWLAMERARLTTDLETRLAQAELMRQLAETLAIKPEMRTAVEQLAPSLRSSTGCELLEVILTDRLAARIFKAARPAPSDRAPMRAWRNDPSPGPVEAGGSLLVPMLLDGAVAGALRLRLVEGMTLDDEPRSLLMAIAIGFAEVVARAVLRERVTRKDRDLAVAQERDRLAHDLHGSVERQLRAAAESLQMAAKQPAQPGVRRAVDSASELVNAARREVHDAISSLSSLRRTDRGLVAITRELAGTLAEGTGATVDVKVVGTVCTLPPAKEGALLRVLHETLTNVERHARASAVWVCLRFGDDDVRLSVRDNGVGLGQRYGAEGGVHAGLRTIQQRLAMAGGTLSFDGDGRRGVRVEAVVPIAP